MYIQRAEVGDIDGHYEVVMMIMRLDQYLIAFAFLKGSVVQTTPLSIWGASPP